MKDPRRPYVKPTVRTYPVFEQNSLGCTKVSPRFGCGGRRAVSRS